MTFATAAEAVADLERQYGPRVAAWTYHHAGGEPAGVVIRWNTATGKKIRPVSKSSAGWIGGGMSEPHPLYRLPELLARPGEPVLVCEGEKATDAVVGDSGTLKSPALEVALQPIRQRQHTAIKHQAAAMQGYQDELLHWEKNMAAWKRNKVDGPPPGKARRTESGSVLVR